MNLKENQFTYFSKFEDILAKPDKTLQQHSIEVAKIAEKIIVNLYIHDKYKEYEKILKDLILLSAYIHDAGKGDKRWQKYIRENREDKPPIPHPLFSLPMAKEYLEENLKINKSNVKNLFVNLGLLAIATHHSPFANEKYEGYEDWTVEYVFNFNKKLKPYEIFKEVERYIIEKMSKDLRYFYVLINGILSLSDWIASDSNVTYEIFDTKNLNNKLENYFKIKGYSMAFYQKKAMEISDDIIIQLPTGCYKTETALFWLTNKITNKVFYILPTVTTVEAMRKRFEEIFNVDEISFSHHLLQIALAKEDKLTTEELFIQKYLLRPLAVTTIDKILLSLMNFHRFTVSEIMLNNATLIIDEIHSYSPFTFSLIIEALKYLKEYHNVKLCIMSATFPSIMKNKVNELKENKFSSLLKDEEIEEIYYKKKRTRIKNFYKNKYLDKNIEIIFNLIPQYKKILIVVNTVTKAQNIYEKIKERANADILVLLLHSRFIYKHRDEKQKILEYIEKLDRDNKLNTKVILISTQIIEVSLDIDFDVLFTEIAPVDAIIQRAGRINRKDKKDISEIHIFDIENNERGYLPYKKEQIEIARNILNNIEIKNEKDYLNINENYYNVIEDYYERELRENYLNRDFLNQIYEKNSIDKVFQTRDGFLTIPLIPICYKKEIESIDNKISKINVELRNKNSNRNELENERLNLFAEKMSYFVPVTIYNAKGNIETFNNIEFINLEYNEDIGLKTRKDDPKLIII